MSDFFVAGGWSMYPTLLAGLGLLGASIQYALRPARRQVPLMVALGLLTLISGGLGFVTGLVECLRFLGGAPSQELSLLAFGVQESLHNVVLALLLAMLAALAASVGAWRLSRQLQPEAC
jgi:hypothetical protein